MPTGSDYTPKVSVIVPVYNVENYLKRCIDSIIAQTLKDIEIILVDDGSTDLSGTLCDELSLQDKRIHVIHKENGGLSSARNAGIDAASAPFLMFIDSDDWVEPNFCEKPYLAAKNNNADLVLFSFRIVRRDGTVLLKKTGMQEGLLNETEAIRYNVTFAHAAWLGLYHRKLFDNIRYPVGKLYEEAATTHKLIHAAQKIWLLNTPLYNYRIGRPGSITTEKESRDHPDLKNTMMIKIKDLYNWGYEEYAGPIAITLLAKYGCRTPEQRQIVKLLRHMKNNKLSRFNWRQIVMWRILRVSTTLFDAISAATGRRKL